MKVEVVRRPVQLEVDDRPSGDPMGAVEDLRNAVVRTMNENA
jgi:hypothetical protein